MNKFIFKLLSKVAAIINIMATKFNVMEEIEPTLQSLRVQPWFKDNGDSTLRIDYDLNEHSVVFDLGGYMGNWSMDIFCKYSPNIYIFEPHIQFSRIIRKRFSHNPKVKIFDFGLSDNNRQENLFVSADASSLYKTEGDLVTIQLKNIEQFLAEYEIKQIDLIKINIEGGEFELLEYLLKIKKIQVFKNIQVQFHDFVPNAIERMKLIQNELSKTHHLTYSYEFVWENWQLNN